MKSMERYSCTKGTPATTPTCEKLSNGPDLNIGRHEFGCGSLKTSQGGRVLLAIQSEFVRSGKNQSTEVLDLTDEGSNWKILSADMDIPEEESSSAYSFVTSPQEPTVGYLLPVFKRYVYRVKCEDAESCSFEKIDTGHYNLRNSITMAIPADSLTCP